MKVQLLKAFSPASKSGLLLRGASFILLLIIALILWNKFGPLFASRELNLYVIDSRNEGEFSEDLLKLFSVEAQRRAGIRVVIHPIVRRVLESTPPWREMVANAANSPRQQALFFELGWPTSSTKKILRAEIETRFSGEERRAMLRRVIAFVAVRDDKAHRACERLRDDWLYMQDNFGGIALIVDDDTLRLVGACLPRLLIELTRNEEG